MRSLMLASVGIILVACTQERKSHEGHNAAPHAAITQGISVSEAWLRPPLPGRDVAAAYFSIQNNGPSDQIIDVKTPISEQVELHTHLHEEGVMKMRRVTAVDIPAQTRLDFKPGSFHVMIFGADISDTAATVSLTLEFVNSGPVTVEAKIDGRGDKMMNPEDHSGH